jgi:hypothetical protein
MITIGSVRRSPNSKLPSEPPLTRVTSRRREQLALHADPYTDATPEPSFALPRRNGGLQLATHMRTRHQRITLQPMALEIPEDGMLVELALDELRPDPRNPRFPPTRQGSFDDDEAIFRYVDREYDAFHVADSILRHGYFPAEPLIVMPSGDGDGYIVLEGNRRLTALKGLASEGRRAEYPDRRWRTIKGTVKLPERYTVYAVNDRARVAPVLGFRHITGIAEWEPYAQARYIAQLVDEEAHSLDDVALLIGRKTTEVRSAYRNYWIAKQARDEFEIPDVDRLTDEFGVWTRAMGNPTLRQYIGAPAPRGVDPDYFPLDDGHKDVLARLLDWLFGSPRDTAGEQKKEPVIAESREITRLGKVVATESGRLALERGWELAAAERATEDPVKAYLARLGEARDALAEAMAARPERSELPVAARALLDECVTLLDQLRELESARAAS